MSQPCNCLEVRSGKLRNHPQISSTFHASPPLESLDGLTSQKLPVTKDHETGITKRRGWKNERNRH